MKVKKYLRKKVRMNRLKIYVQFNKLFHKIKHRKLSRSEIYYL